MARIGAHHHQNIQSQQFEVLRKKLVITGCFKAVTMKHNFQDSAMSA